MRSLLRYRGSSVLNIAVLAYHICSNMGNFYAVPCRGVGGRTGARVRHLQLASCSNFRAARHRQGALHENLNAM